MFSVCVITALGGAGVEGQGNAGGNANAGSPWTGGGGGGAGGAGGAGIAVHITGEERWLAGGGGGAADSAGSNTGGSGVGGTGGVGNNHGQNGTANTGNGGGGARSSTSTQGVGGDGGSGTVIVRYWGGPAATGGTISAGAGSAEGYTIHTFTTGGLFDLSVPNVSSAISGNMTGTGGFTWDSPGMLTLTGMNTYAGDTRIAAGTLALAGTSSIAGSATIDVHAEAYFNVAGTADMYILSGGQTLTGSGTVVGDLLLDSGSVVSPGATIGALHFQDRLTLGAGSGIHWQFSSTGNAGVHDDSMIGLGEDAALYLPDPDSGRIELSIFGPGASLRPGDTFTLFDGNVFDHQGTLFDHGTDLTGLFHIAADHSGWWGTWELSAGSLILTAVPEPGTWLLLLSALACGLLVRRRK